jgi:hypothetical protein
MENCLFAVDLYSVASIMTTLKSANGMNILAKHINYFAFTLIAPLKPKDQSVFCHRKPI